MRLSQRAPRSGAAALALAAAIAATGAVGPPQAQAGTGRGHRAVTERLALEAGLQVGPKHTTRPQVKVGGARYAAPNPYLAEVPAGTRVDWSYWRNRLRATSQKRQSTTVAGADGAARMLRSYAVPTPYSYDEQEPVGQRNSNDSQGTAERLTSLGIGRRWQAVKVLGRLSQPVSPARKITTREDQGSIPRATSTRVSAAHPRITLTSKIGDGPHGRAGDGNGDFDFFKVRAVAGQSIRANTHGSSLDTVLAVYDAAGEIVAANDDDGELVQSKLAYEAPRTAYYYVMVGGFDDFGGVPEDPFRSGSGSGYGDQGTYRLDLTSGPVDKDYYGVNLHSGDVLGGTLNGPVSGIEVHRVDGHDLIGSDQDASSAYPAQSPLPGIGSTFAYVAEEPGWYAVSTQTGRGDYQMLLETYRPGSERAASGAVQKLFLDFDGERLNTNIFGGPGVSTLSPMTSFLGRWGLTSAAKNAVIDATVASVTENLRTTLQEKGLNGKLRIDVLNSRDDADPFGDPNVSRVVVGGTIEQTGVPTIGIAQSIDPGNYAHEETAAVLLDVVSAPSGPGDSFNTYLKAGSNKTSFIGHALGNLVAHETGHMVGSFHTDEMDSRVNLMDAGGANYRRMFGVGPDRVGGTADDTDVDFGEDTFSPEEGFAGTVDTLNNTAWAFVPGTR